MTRKIYFQGFSEVRGIAALLVVFHHVELYKHRDGSSGLYETPLNFFISSIGKNSVYVFFVLSGFLITYLLLYEKKLKSIVDLKKFYLRRILRIWPLYYFIVLISFTLIPLIVSSFDSFMSEKYYYHLVQRQIDSPYLALFLFLLILPNLALKLNQVVVGASQSWSIGVEEQFYLIWPNIINKIHNKTLLISIFLVLSILPNIILEFKNSNIKIIENIIFIIELLPFHFMSIGSVGAFCLFYHGTMIQWIFKNSIFYLINTILLFVLLFYNVDIPLINLFYGFIVLFQIIFITQNTFKVNLRNKLLAKIGDVSYGVYMYHPIVMFLSFTVFNNFTTLKDKPILYNLCLYISVFSISIVVSYFSFKYFENWFLKIKKKKFTIVKSGRY